MKDIKIPDNAKVRKVVFFFATLNYNFLRLTKTTITCVLPVNGINLFLCTLLTHGPRSDTNPTTVGKKRAFNLYPGPGAISWLIDKPFTLTLTSGRWNQLKPTINCQRFSTSVSKVSGQHGQKQQWGRSRRAKTTMLSAN